MTPDTELQELPWPGAFAFRGVELRHLRYLVAVADAGTITHAAERMLIAQPSVSQQIRRLEELVGTRLLYRRPHGIQLTAAGSVLLEESRTILSLLEQGVARSRKAAGLGRPRIRFLAAPNLPDTLAVTIWSRLQRTAPLAGVDITWIEAPVDGEFTPIRQRRADAGLGWLTCPPEALPDPLDVMALGEFEPEVWVPATSVIGDRQSITLDELAAMDVIHGPRHSSPGTYDAWGTVLRARRPCFEFADPPFEHSLRVTLALAGAASRPTGVLTSPRHRIGGNGAPDGPTPAADHHDMVRVALERRPLTATAAVAWGCDLPRHLQQLLFDTADEEIGYPTSDT
jgi:DNA-binding transcriptional LysR family regulator